MAILITASLVLIFISIVSSSRIRIPVAINFFSNALKNDFIKNELRFRPRNFFGLLDNKRMLNSHYHSSDDTSSFFDQKPNPETSKSYEEISIDFYLKDKENVSKFLLNNTPIPNHLLINSKFFEEALNRGYRSLCLHLIQNTEQKFEILKENGENLLVKIIEKGMSELFGVLLTKRKAETLKAFDVVDSISGQTPLLVAINYGDRLAIYYLISEKNEKQIS